MSELPDGSYMCGDAEPYLPTTGLRRLTVPYEPTQTAPSNPFYVGDSPGAYTPPPVQLGPIQLTNPDGTPFGLCNGTNYVRIHPDDMATIRTMIREEVQAALRQEREVSTHGKI